jgi:acyl-coenzyme A thioesterase PaaI-like protein
MSEHDHAYVDPLVHVAQLDHPDRLADARASAGKAVRDLGHAIVGHHAPLELIDRLSSTLEALRAELSTLPVRTRAESRSHGEWSEPPEDGATLTSYDERPVSGRASPWSLDLHLWRDGNEVAASVTMQAAHEGAPGRSHGGIVAALFDDVFAFMLSLVAEPAFTGELSIRYEAGVPIGVPLECRVRLADRDGRKLYLTGELSDQGRVVARSKATFITIDRDQFMTGAAS